MSDISAGLEFPVTIYGNLEKYNDVISKGRCRIFYKYGNRNGTYITDEFAEKLLATIPYAPVKGIYEEEDSDYSDHGTARSQGRIYGIVPENPNLQWEEHEDEDGVTRTYACVDVLVFTALYTEANIILNKSQSMELYLPSIKGSWKVINGRKYYVYESACFLGLQVLGDTVEPCFEGAAFYTLYNDLNNLLTKAQERPKGEKTMTTFQLSDDEKYMALMKLLNPQTESGDYLFVCSIMAVYDNYALVRNYESEIYERVYYSKDDETDSVEITGREQCFVLDVTLPEYNALKSMRALCDSYEQAFNDLESMGQLTANLTSLEESVKTLTEQNSEFSAKIVENEQAIATLTAERDSAISALEEEKTSLATLMQENSTLTTFKTQVETSQKQAIIDKYSSLLDSSILDTYSSNLDAYTVTDLAKELAYQLVSNNQSVFTSTGEPILVPKVDTEIDGLTAILKKYQK